MEHSRVSSVKFYVLYCLLHSKGVATILRVAFVQNRCLGHSKNIPVAIAKSFHVVPQLLNIRPKVPVSGFLFSKIAS